ncbi:putative phage-associated protein [Bacteroidales bacterium Barb6]|nr:putative phage-associated protein [Bacteroidales bacterium Barb6]
MCYCNGYSGLAVADYLVEKALQDGTPISNMTVLKMIFFAQGFGFPDLNRRLIRDEFYAWQWGPVEEKTYKAFRKYGGNGIMRPSNKAKRGSGRYKSAPRDNGAFRYDIQVS